MNKAKGFTLIEVLFALVIISIAFSGVMYSINSASRNFQNIRQKTAATWVASNVIAQAQLQLLDGSRSGHEKMLDRDWSWQFSINPTPNSSVNEIKVSVSDTITGKVVTQLQGYIGAGNEEE